MEIVGLDPIKVLGVCVGYNQNLVDQKNYLDILKNIRGIPNI